MPHLFLPDAPSLEQLETLHDDLIRQLDALDERILEVIAVAQSDESRASREAGAMGSDHSGQQGGIRRAA